MIVSGVSLALSSPSGLSSVEGGDLGGRERVGRESWLRDLERVGREGPAVGGSSKFVAVLLRIDFSFAVRLDDGENRCEPRMGAVPSLQLDVVLDN